MLVLMSLLWALAHRYAGLVQDGELYAMQALSRLQPGLRGDLYLANVSQDRFTFFSPLYAFLIQHLGLWPAGTTLFVISRTVFYAAAWALVRHLADAQKAWLSVMFLMTAVGEYGAYGVFNFAESYLTARSVAEALVIGSVYLALTGRTAAAWCLIALSFAMHPLMSLPGALLLLCLWMRPRRALALAAASLCAAVAVAMLVSRAHLNGALQTIDGQWLEVVRQRSQFLFLEEWRPHDWEIHLRGFLGLALVSLVLPDPRIRNLSGAAAIVGASGLGLAWIAGATGPVALLLQSQPWRWFWVTSFASIALLGPLVTQLWRNGGVGRFAATLMVVSWVFPVTDGLLMAAAALTVWTLRAQIGQSMQRLLEFAAYLVVVAVVAWTLANTWSSIVSPLAENGDGSPALSHVRAIFQLRPAAVFLVLISVWWLHSRATRLSAGSATAVGIVLVALVLPESLSQRNSYGTAREVLAFDGWRKAIPADANVLSVPTTTVSAFEWFTLERPSYLSMNQSAGVVFSRVTAGEVARRSEILLPISQPDWQIRRRLQLGIKREDERRPLTDESLKQICADPALGFVISAENLNYPSLLHSESGTYKGSRLYNCGKIRDTVPN